ncbi:MAG: hypothetical protein ACYC0V_15500 [Armatimonadota bacterium]
MASDIVRHSDWEKVKARWTAFWEKSETDRPCLDIVVPVDISDSIALQQAAPEDTWFDPEWVSRFLLQSALSREYFGEAIPSDGAKVLMTGWTHGFGNHIGFSHDTIWHQPYMNSLDNADKWNPSADDPWRMKTETLLRHLLHEMAGKILITYPYQLPLNDLFSAMRGPENLLVDLALDVNQCGSAIEASMPRWIENFEYFRRIIETAQDGCFWGWPGIWCKDFVMITQSDISCMISESAFERYVMRELEILGRRYDRLWYHLDGKGARRHLPRLLNSPYIKAIQYVASPDEEPNGPAHLELYRSIQTAGRCVDIAVPPENVECLVRHLNPEGLVIRTWASTRTHAEELLENSTKWCGTHAGAALPGQPTVGEEAALI